MNTVVQDQDLLEALRSVSVHCERKVLVCPGIEEVVKAIRDTSPVAITIVSGFQLKFGESVEEIDKSNKPRFVPEEGCEFVFDDCSPHIFVREVRLTEVSVLNVGADGGFVFRGRHVDKYEANHGAPGVLTTEYTIRAERTPDDTPGPEMSVTYEREVIY